MTYDTTDVVLDELVDVANAWSACVRLEWVRLDDGNQHLRAIVITHVVTVAAWADDLDLPDEPTAADVLASMGDPRGFWEVVSD